MLVRSSWVDYDGDMYFVNSAGQKITNDWRLTTPYDDEDAEEEWYYFQASGKMATNKKIVYKGNTYFFNADGKMLTGWVTADGTDVVNEESTIDKDYTFYADETGARVETDWILTVEPGTEEDDADADYYYYYLLSSGKVATGKRNNIKGQTYLFDEEGKMLSGWVRGTEVGSGSNADTIYEEIDGENSNIELVNAADVSYYYCGGADDGHVKKDKWIKTWRPMNTYEEDEDVSKYWYWIESNGEVFVANVKHFFTLLGKMFFTSYGKEFFTYHGKQIFTLPGTTFLHGMVSRLCCLFNFSDKGPGASAGRILL